VQQYQVPGSNVTIAEAMILFTGRAIHITMMPKKPISQGYKFFSMAEKGYVWEFHPSLKSVGGDPVAVKSCLVQLINTGEMIHHWIRRLHQRHRKLSSTIYMDKFFAAQPLPATLRRMGIAGCGSWMQQFQ